jgi:hypothetical protein
MHGMFDDMDPEDFNDSTVYESDPALKRKMGRPQLTAGRIVSSQHSKKVFFGHPDPLLVIEDICARKSL